MPKEDVRVDSFECRCCLLAFEIRSSRPAGIDADALEASFADRLATEAVRGDASRRAA